MSKHIKLTSKNAGEYFYLEKLTPEKTLDTFECSISEYNDYLIKDAVRSFNDHIAKTWLLCETKTGKITAYMSLIMWVKLLIVMKIIVLPDS